MKFSEIYKEAEENARLAILSLWTPGPHPMRKAIENLLKREPLLAEPVFQSTFGWQVTSDNNWRNYLNADVISRLEDVQRNIPYLHQSESWKKLHDGKSIVVTSGTGSGKTKCFMYPVLSDLYEQMQKGEANKIQAIFLYPLNALMEDQKERLSGYCSAVDANLRFAAYNGNTPERRLNDDMPPFPNEIATREDIRNIRPQILLSNPSMLEYILVRKADQKMLEESAGSLRWIVIDEAHSYSGSAAVELSYQIKRILDAFGTPISQVRFVCTSATIGGKDGEQKLKDFISTLTGKPAGDIQVIGGSRVVPELDREELSRQLAADNLPAVERVLNLRKKINEVPGMNLQQICDILCPEIQSGQTDADNKIIRLLGILDKLCDLKINDSPVLSLRAHFFMRTISGLYACCNEHCDGADGTPFGYLTTRKAGICPECGRPLFEILQCKDCNSFILSGHMDGNTNEISPLDTSEYDAEDDENYEESADADNGHNNANDGSFFVKPYAEGPYIVPVQNENMRDIHFDIIECDGRIKLEINLQRQGRWIQLMRQDDNRHSSMLCPECGKLVIGKKLHLQHFRIPINFINQVIAPVLLHECAPQGRDWGKYIAFTDSRQGTAISAKTFNIDSEKVQCRAKIMKEFAVRQSNPVIPGLDLGGFDEDMRNHILQQLRNQPVIITLRECADIIFDESLFRHFSDDPNNHESAYKAALIRHFIGRKPAHESNIETMGLVTLVYPGLANIGLPNILPKEKWNHLGITPEAWRNYLKLMLDYFMRMGNHIQPLVRNERQYVRNGNIGTPVAGPDNGRAQASKWPSVKRNANGSISIRQSRMVRLLCAGLGIDTLQRLDQESVTVNRILVAAWNDLVRNGILTQVTPGTGFDDPDYYPGGRYVGCYYLDLSQNSNVGQLKRTETAWLCPVSGQLLDTTFRGFSPLIGNGFSKDYFEKFRCSEQVTMPERPADDNAVDDWMKEDENIGHLKVLGIWNNRYKYTYRAASAYMAAEHSAQQSKKLLQQYTEDFKNKNNSINVLHCSTTMEMGVDIGDIDVVLMDTVPPTSANYMQRVGRAGRNGQTKSLAFSLCNDSPVGQQAFSNPMWALASVSEMSSVKESGVIIQRHVNSFFFRSFICSDMVQGIDIRSTVDDFFSTLYDRFVEFLETVLIDENIERKFQNVFGNNVPFDKVRSTKECIEKIKSDYDNTIHGLENALLSIAQENRENRRSKEIAISSQVIKCKKENMLGYLSEHQFIPNANMPTGIVAFDFMDSDEFEKLNEQYDKLRRIIQQNNAGPAEAIQTREQRANIESQISEIKRSTVATRDVRTALSEYAPGQTVVVNEGNYVSAGVMMVGEYDVQTRTRYIYHCENCGHIEYLAQLYPNRQCPICNSSYHGIINRRETTKAYEPVGFCADKNVSRNRQEKTTKQYYNIRPVLLDNDGAATADDVVMCQRSFSGDSGGEILFYNSGIGMGFAICKRCGRAAVESAVGRATESIPQSLRSPHKDIRYRGANCDANIHNDADFARNVVLAGRHQTCYSVFKFFCDVEMQTADNDEQLAYSLGVVLTKALAKKLGIDENEVAFGVKQEGNVRLLFIYDTAKGGCGYSLEFKDPVSCQQIFDIARQSLEDCGCDCEIREGACTSCLIDRNSTRFANKLNKAKALSWLRQQHLGKRELPMAVRDASPEAAIVYRSLKNIALQHIVSKETEEVTFVVSDSVGDVAVTDWLSIHAETGRLVRKALDKGIKVSLKVEFHPELHISLADRKPYIDLKSKFTDCDVQFVKDLGQIKPAVVVKDIRGNYKRYFIFADTENENCLAFSDDWGNGCDSLFEDNIIPEFVSENEPEDNGQPSEIIREGFASSSRFHVGNYYSKAIQDILSDEDKELLARVLQGRRVTVSFSDMYVNSALASLMLTYLIKEMRDMYGFVIDNINLYLDSPRRKCTNEKFNDYSYISYNFSDKDSADEYTDYLIHRELDVDAEHSGDAGHHRWLRILTDKGDMVEIRPDHGISGGWESKNTYMNSDRLDGNVVVTKKETDILYYVIIRPAD